MEIQLSELIEQIKKDGVAVAENESNAIVDSAKKEAEEKKAEGIALIGIEDFAKVSLRVGEIKACGNIICYVCRRSVSVDQKSECPQLDIVELANTSVQLFIKINAVEFI